MSGGMAPTVSWGSYLTIPAPIVSRGQADLYYIGLDTKSATYILVLIELTADLLQFMPIVFGPASVWIVIPAVIGSAPIE
jgi:hypothetical protein